MAPKSHGAGDLRLRAFVLSGWTGRHCAHTRRSEMIGLARPHMRFDQLAAYVVDLTPDWVAGITDLPAAQIREAAQVVAADRPQTAVIPARHTIWYGNDSQRMRSTYLGNALLDVYGRNGDLS